MKPTSFLLSLVLLLGLVGCTSAKQVSIPPTPISPLNAAPAVANYRVKRIADGDTITVTNSRGADTRVRFACIDAPEVPHTKTERSSYDPADLDQFK